MRKQKKEGNSMAEKYYRKKEWLKKWNKKGNKEEAMA
jgi:hypothetical protein